MQGYYGFFAINMDGLLNKYGSGVYPLKYFRFISVWLWNTFLVGYLLTHVHKGSLALGLSNDCPCAVEASLIGTVKPVYNDHLMGNFSAFWSSPRWPWATSMSSRRQKLLARVNWYLQSSLKPIIELITGNKDYYRGGRYRQVSLYW